MHGIIIAAFMVLVPPQEGFYCRWGEPVQGVSFPGCGTPRRIRTPLPPSGKRLEFRKADNPGLSGYFIRRKDGTGPLKRMRNLVNLYAVDLFLCPKDFESPRTLLFHMKSGSGWHPVQCKLGPVGHKDTMGAAAATSPPRAPEAQNGSRKNGEARPREQGDRSQKNESRPRTGPITKELELPACVAPKKDSLARIVAWSSLAAGITALLLAFWALWRTRRLRPQDQEGKDEE